MLRRALSQASSKLPKAGWKAALGLVAAESSAGAGGSARTCGSALTAALRPWSSAASHLGGLRHYSSEDGGASSSSKGKGGEEGEDLGLAPVLSEEDATTMRVRAVRLAAASDKLLVPQVRIPHPRAGGWCCGGSRDHAVGGRQGRGCQGAAGRRQASWSAAG